MAYNTEAVPGLLVLLSCTRKDTKESVHARSRLTPFCAKRTVSKVRARIPEHMCLNMLLLFSREAPAPRYWC